MIKTIFTKNIFLFFIICTAAFLRLYHLDFQSIWDDEIVTMIESNPAIGLREAYHTYMDFDNMPPLYFFILRYLFKFFGYTTIILRGFSAFLGIASIFAVYKLGKEISSKNAGLYAASLLAVNQFHIFYSQEARPYSFLVLFTILSFYCLVLFIKNASYKNLFLYSVATSLMLYGQFFAISALFGQIAILLYFIYKTEPPKRLAFFFKITLAGFLILLAYVPALPQMIKNTKIKSSWISAPLGNEYTSYINQFFGNSEMLVPIIYLLIIVYFVHLSMEKKEEILISDTRDFGSLKFSFIIISAWLSFSLLIPLISSYLVLPMLLPRYFTHLIPAIIIMASIGINQFKSSLVRLSFIGLLLAFSLNDLFIVKKYYSVLTKAQYRETSQFINEHKKASDIIVAKVGLHYGHFFMDNISNSTFFWNSLDRHVSEILSDTAKQTSFWYASVHENKFEFNPGAETIFKIKYYINKKVDFFNTSASLFKPIPSNWIKLDLQTNQAMTSFNDVLIMDGSSSISSLPILLKKGVYHIIVSAKSVPTIPINNINAHLTFKLGGKIVGGCFLNEKYYNTQKLDLFLPADTNAPLEIHFDNDLIVENVDRNANLLSLFLEKL